MTTLDAVPSGSGAVVFGSPTHAIVLPSCDQRGDPSLPQFVLIFSTFFEATSARYTSRRLSRSIGVVAAPNANCLLSGDHDGAPCTVHDVPSVMRDASFEFTSTTQMCWKRKSPSNTRSSSRFLMSASSAALRGSVVMNAIFELSGDHA